MCANEKSNKLAQDLDTIIAMATAPGAGAIAIVKLSGEKAKHIATQLIENDKTLCDRFATLTYLYDSNEQAIDRAIVIYYQGPRSFTGEDVVELQLHASMVIVNEIIELCVHLGARLAEPGEFSRRAYLNNKSDITQLQAVSDLIAAQSKAAAKSAMRSLSGEFSRRVDKIKHQLIHLRKLLEAHMDFSDEDITLDGQEEINKLAKKILDDFRVLIDESKSGSILRDGINIAIVGKPNVGKSSLLNWLAQVERSIVSDIAGTTRDVVRDTIKLNSLVLHVADTAGIRDTDCDVEKKGVQLAYDEVAKVDMVWVLVESKDILHSQEDVLKILKTIESITDSKENILIVENKIDLTHNKVGFDFYNGYKKISLSAKRELGKEELTKFLMKNVGLSASSSHFIVRGEQLKFLSKAEESMQQGYDSFLNHQAMELLAEDCLQAQRCLDPVVGKITSDDLLGEIFSSFCIGK